MLKLFLVEDEIIVREGIKKKINWEEHGFTFVGEASDGELAYPLIQQTRPDVVITDIQMPFMDGLELSRLVKREMPWIKIIILSGYDEFEYAKEAISIGVTDYLLKPIASAKIIETIQRVKEIIQEEQRQKEVIKQFQIDLAEQEQLNRQRFFAAMVAGKQPVSELLERAQQLGIDLLAQGYSVVLFNISPVNGNTEAYSQQVVRLEQRVLEQFSAKPSLLLVKRDLGGYALLVKGSEQQSAGELAKRSAQELAELFDSEQELWYSIGVGVPVQRLSELPNAFETAARAFAHRYLLKKNEPVFADSLQEQAPTQDEQISFATLDTSKMDRRVVESFLKSGLCENAGHFMEGYLENFGEEPVKSLLFRQYIAMDVQLAAVLFLEQLGIDKALLVEQCGDIGSVTDSLASREGTQAYLTQMLTSVLFLRDQASSQRYRSVLSAAREYIQHNYANEEMSLNQVAQAVNISPAHFSSIFSQEGNQTFIEYLTSVRMEKAKELLRCTSMKSSQIAYAVGYKDPHYFSYLFKKMQGCTPKEFRAGKAAEE